MKKQVSVFLCILLCVSAMPAVRAEQARDVSAETALAGSLQELGLFLGVGETDGTTDFALHRAPSRVEALVMLVRALGKGAVAEAYPKTHPFTDIPAWADGYVSYAYDNGLTNGVSETRFHPDGTAPCEAYLTFMLRALGYSDGEAGDFKWNSPWALAAHCGLLPVSVDKWAFTSTGVVGKLDFTRADIVTVTCAALYATVNGTGLTLGETLIAEGAFTAGQFDKAFPEDPFAEFRLMDARVSAAIAAHAPTGALGNNRFAAECHIITNVYEWDGAWTVAALVCVGEAALGKGNTINSGMSSVDFWLLELNSENVLSCRTAVELSAQGVAPEDVFPEQTRDALFVLGEGLFDLCAKILRRQLDSGLLEYQQPTYAEALAEVKNSLMQVAEIWEIEMWETEQCTVLRGVIGGVPHGPHASIRLIYKPGSAMGEGETVGLPLPYQNAWGRTDLPDAQWLSEDGLTLYYTCHFNERMVLDPGTPSEQIIHEAGTYSYTVDLTTGEVSLEIIPDE